MGRVERGSRRYEIHIVAPSGRQGDDDAYVSVGRRAEALLVPGTRFKVLEREDGVKVWAPAGESDRAAGRWETKTVVFLEEI